MPLLNEGTNADVGVTLAEELVLGGATQGYMQGQLNLQSYKIKRLLARLTLAVRLEQDDSATGHQRARHVLVRMGIFKGMTDMSGALLNGNEFQLDGMKSIPANNELGTLARQNRFVWLREFHLCNYIGANPHGWSGGSGYNPLYGSAIAGPWPFFGDNLQFGGPCYWTEDIDVKNLGTTGPEERWFLARYAVDMEASDPSHGFQLTVNYHFNPRLLLQRAAGYRRKPGV